MTRRGRSITALRLKPPSRNANIQHTGVAVARDVSSGYLFAVQVFGRPPSAAFEFRFAIRTSSEVQYQVIGDENAKTFTLPPANTSSNRSQEVVAATAII